MAISYPIYRIEFETVQLGQARSLSQSFFEYEISYEDSHTFEGHTLEAIAMRFYGSRRSWYLIYDYNPGLAPDDFVEGMVVRIPILRDIDTRPVRAFDPRP